MRKVWREIKGFPGYKISNFGEVKSFKYKVPRIIKYSLGSSGYKQVHLRTGNKSITMMIHRIVAKTFIDNKQNYEQVNHKDENKLNNRVDNLEWCDRLYNVRYGTGIERMAKNHNYKESAKKSALHHDYAKIAKARSKPILQISLDNNVIKKWDSAHDIYRQLGYSCGNISKACTNNYIRYGYKWAFC